MLLAYGGPDDELLSELSVTSSSFETASLSSSDPPVISFEAVSYSDGAVTDGAALQNVTLMAPADVDTDIDTEVDVVWDEIGQGEDWLAGDAATEAIDALFEDADEGGNEQSTAGENRPSLETSFASAIASWAEPDFTVSLREDVTTSAVAAPVSDSTSVDLSTTFGQLPLRFEANNGQTDARVDFLARGLGYTLFLTPGEAVLSLRGADGAQGSDSSSVLRAQLVGANAASFATPLDELPGRSNYLLGNDPAKWITDVPAFGQVRYDNVYPGVDLVYYGTGGRLLEYDFIVAPRVDPAIISLGFTGQESTRIDAAGNLILGLPGGDITLAAPIAYQQIDAQRQPVTSRYVLASDGRVGFEIGEYDPSLPLVIDPVLSFSTYLGGSGTDTATAVTVDAAGTVYVAGETTSLNFPTSTPPQASRAGSNDAFVVSLTADGSSVRYATYLGGRGTETAGGIAVNDSSEAVVVGSSTSTDFPTATGAVQRTLQGSRAAFVVKLNKNGNALAMGTYLGGGGSDRANDVVLDAAGTIYLTGETTSTDFPTTRGAFQETGGSANKAFVSKLTGDGRSVTYSTYVGSGTSTTEVFGRGISVDSRGFIYVAGKAEASFPTTAGAVQASFEGGGSDAFALKLSPGGRGAADLVYATYLGGKSADEAWDIALDSRDNVLVVGTTSSSGFPVFKAAQGAGGGTSDGFLTKISPDGRALVYSTFVGGSGTDRGTGVSVDRDDRTTIVGMTGSSNFPVLNAFQPTQNAGSDDAFVARFDAGGALDYASYLGGAKADEATAVAVDGNGNAVVVGFTTSIDFPNNGAVQPNSGGGRDAFIARVDTRFTIAWDGDGGADNRWQNPINWSGDRLPNSSDDVLIDVPGNVTVLLSSGTQTVRSLLSRENITVSGGALAVVDTADYQGDVTLSGSGAVAGSGTHNFNGQLTWSGGFVGVRFSSAPTLNINGGGAINGSAVKTFAGGTFNNRSDLTWDDAGNINVDIGGVFNNHSNGKFFIRGNAQWTRSNGTMTFNNDGLIVKSAGTGSSVFNSTLITLNNNGTIRAESGMLRLHVAGGAGSGDFAATLDGTLEISAGTFNQTSGGALLSDAGSTIRMTGGTATFGGVTQVSGNTIITAGALRFSGDAETTSLGEVLLSGGELGGTGGKTIGGLLIWTGGRLGTQFNGTGVIDLDGGVAITGSNNKTLGGGTYNNAGVLTWQGNGNLLVNTGGTFNNLAGAEFLIQTDADVTRQNGGLVFNNFGLLVKQASAGTTSYLPSFSSFNNNGTVRIETGTLQLARGGSGSGALEIMDAATLRFSAGMQTFSAGSRLDIAPEGTLRIDGGILAIAGTINVEGLTQITAGGLRLNGIAATSNLAEVFLSGGELGGTGSKNVNGLLNWTGGSLGTRFNSAGVLNLNGGVAITGSNTKTFAGGTYNNLGTLTWTGTGNLNVNTGGTFNNLLGATFDIQNDADVTRSNGAMSFFNDGLLVKSAGSGETLYSVSFSSFTNRSTGVVEVASGTLRIATTFPATPGTIRLDGGTLRLSNTLTLQADGVLEGAGTILTSVTNGGRVQLGGSSAGLLTIDGNYTQLSTGDLQMQIGGPLADVDYDHLHVTGSVTLGGILNVTLIDNFVPRPGDTFDVVTYASHVGTFETVNLPTLVPGQNIDVVYTESAVRLVARSLPVVAVDNDLVRVDEGQVAVNTGSFADADGDVVTVTASVGTISQEAGTWSWSFNTSDGPDQNQTVTITATDASGDVATTTFPLEVLNVAPRILADTDFIEVDEGHTATNGGSFSDPGDDVVTITASVGTITQDAGTWSWSLDTTNAAGDSQTVTLAATDSDGARRTTTFKLKVLSTGIPADLNGNGFVDFQDLTILLANWNQNVSAANGNLVNPDTTPVNFQDLTVLLAAWTGPGPAASPPATAAKAGVLGGAGEAAQNTATSASGATTIAPIDRPERRDLATIRRDIQRAGHAMARSASPSTPRRRLSAVAVERAIGEKSESARPLRASAFLRRRL